jgi:hypothetical protein
MRDNHLRVGLGAEGSRLKEWLLEPGAPLVDIEASLNVVDRIDDEVKTIPEFVVEEVLCVRCDEFLIVTYI